MPGPGTRISSSLGQVLSGGLEPFEAEHAAFYFGREAMIEQLVARVKGRAFGRGGAFGLRQVVAGACRIDDGTARLWDAATGVQLALLSGHLGPEARGLEPRWPAAAHCQ